MFLPQSAFCANCLTFLLILYFIQYFIVPYRKFGFFYPGKAQELQEQCYPFLLVCAVFPCVQTMVWLPVFGIFNVAQMLMHVIAHRGCMDTIRESALETDSGRKIPCCTRDVNLCQYCTWIFSWMLYQLSYPHSTPCPTLYSPYVQLHALTPVCMFKITNTSSRAIGLRSTAHARSTLKDGLLWPKWQQNCKQSYTPFLSL